MKSSPVGVLASLRQDNPRPRSFLLRHEIRSRNNRRCTIILALCVPAVFLAGMGLGYSMAEAGFIHTVSVILIGAGVGICIHKLTHPIL